MKITPDTVFNAGLWCVSVSLVAVGLGVILMVIAAFMINDQPPTP